jgi:hypothetical protein
MDHSEILKGKVVLVVDNLRGGLDAEADILEIRLVTKADDVKAAHQYLMTYLYGMAIGDIVATNRLELLKACVKIRFSHHYADVPFLWSMNSSIRCAKADQKTSGSFCITGDADLIVGIVLGASHRPGNGRPIRRKLRRVFDNPGRGVPQAFSKGQNAAYHQSDPQVHHVLIAPLYRRHYVDSVDSIDGLQPLLPLNFTAVG